MSKWKEFWNGFTQSLRLVKDNTVSDVEMSTDLVIIEKWTVDLETWEGHPRIFLVKGDTRKGYRDPYNQDGSWTNKTAFCYPKNEAQMKRALAAAQAECDKRNRVHTSEVQWKQKAATIYTEFEKRQEEKRKAAKEAGKLKDFS